MKFVISGTFLLISATTRDKENKQEDNTLSFLLIGNKVLILILSFVSFLVLVKLATHSNMHAKALWKVSIC